MRGVIKFSEHPYSINWSEKNVKSPKDFSIQSHSSATFKCPNCIHEFESKLYNVSNGKYCPYCAIPSRKMCDKENCTECFNKSFASSEKAKFWSDKNAISPRNVFKKTDIKYVFNCDKCNHEFKIALDKLAVGGWCPFCYGKQLCDTECSTCFNRSFASHSYSNCWSIENSISPTKVALHCNKKFKFECDKCNSQFLKDPNSILRGEWCPLCKNKSEAKLFEYLKNLFPNTIREFNEKWMGRLRYDFLIPELKLIIELDGEQHFEQIMNWASPEHQLVNDVYKTKLANENGYTIIRLLQKEVFYNKIEWLDTHLKPHLTKQSENLFITIHEKYKNIYLGHK